MGTETPRNVTDIVEPAEEEPQKFEPAIVTSPPAEVRVEGVNEEMTGGS